MSLTSLLTVMVKSLTYDLTILDNVKTDLGITDKESDARLATWIKQGSGAIASYCNRVFGKEILEEKFWPQREAFSVVRGSLDVLQLGRWPVSALPSLAGIAAPAAPVLSQAAGGQMGGRRYYVKASYVTSSGDETPGSQEAYLQLSAGNLLQVASPPQDAAGLAIGWNLYVGRSSWKEVLQNAAPLPIGSGWSETVTGLVTSAASLPSMVLVVENGVVLIEGVDFDVDANQGHLVRLDVNGYPKPWRALPIVVDYAAGYDLLTELPYPLEQATISFVKRLYFAADRDPLLRQESIPGIRDAQYWVATGKEGALTPYEQGLIDPYRVPVAR